MNCHTNVLDETNSLISQAFKQQATDFNSSGGTEIIITFMRSSSHIFFRAFRATAVLPAIITNVASPALCICFASSSLISDSIGNYLVECTYHIFFQPLVGHTTVIAGCFENISFRASVDIPRIINISILKYPVFHDPVGIVARRSIPSNAGHLPSSW